jgi:SnoaL-like domain
VASPDASCFPPQRPGVNVASVHSVVGPVSQLHVVLRHGARNYPAAPVPARPVRDGLLQRREPFLGLMDADVELLAAMEGSYRGHDGVRRWWDDLLNAIPDLTIEVGEVRNLGDVTVTALRFRGRGAESDTPFEQLRWNAARWRRGKCIWWRTLQTEPEAFDAVRLSE